MYTLSANINFTSRSLCIAKASLLTSIPDSFLYGTQALISAKQFSILYTYIHSCIHTQQFLRRNSTYLNSASKYLRSTSSKSSPPKRVSPLVAFTSNTPPLISKIEISNVPPPRSKTAIVLPSAYQFHTFIHTLIQIYKPSSRYIHICIHTYIH